jgi:hypothetical protein
LVSVILMRVSSEEERHRFVDCHQCRTDFGRRWANGTEEIEFRKVEKLIPRIRAQSPWPRAAIAVGVSVLAQAVEKLPD